MRTRTWSAIALASIIVVAAVAVTAASLAITRASWDGTTLSLAGTAPANTAVTLSNAATGAVLSTVTPRGGGGRWRTSLQALSSVPCTVRAVQGTASTELAVSGAPSTCDNGTTRTLSSLTINGSSSVPESSSATYTATAAFTDGSTAVVTQAATWTENSGSATIAGGVLTTSAVSANQALTISSSYTAGGLTRSATLAVTIQNMPALSGSHAGRISTYEGTATCLRCHESEARAFHQSVHYQWSGDASDADRDASGTPLSSPAGKMGGINDFCIYPDINWLGKLTRADNQAVVDGGCARCHTGLGLKPTPNPDDAGQLQNIDCLLCHSPNYKRTLAPVGPNGSLAFVADTANMSVPLLQAAVDIRLPSKDTCLNCHTKAGGGNNFKRGDIEEAHRTATTSLDVHMAPTSQGGAGLSCTGCHQAAGHRIAGRGVDMRQRDADTPTPACATCHTTTPHGDSRLNQHTARVACNVCHVPSFAKTAPTDMRRDWSLPGEISPVTGLWEPHMAMQSNVTPAYRFFNGRSQFYEFRTRAVPQGNGRVLMAGPLGSITEPGAKITAMKRHEGRQPIDPITGFLLPLKIGTFFQTGDLDAAVDGGILAMGWQNSGYQFAETERFMGLYHEVAPKEQALSCSTCHDNNRLPFADLGYTPRPTGSNGRPLCSSCHETKSATFYNLHDKHVRDKRLDCSSCHTFSKAVGG
jgi:hypothetical protein